MIKFFLNAFCLFFLIPVVVAIHEAGHAFFVKLFGGKVATFAIGSGKRIFRFKNFEIRERFAGGECIEDFSHTNKLNDTQWIWYALGGVMATFTVGIMLTFVLNHIQEETFLYNYLSVVRLLFIFDCFNLIPMKVKGYPSDGLYIVKAIKRIIFKSFLKN